MRTTLDSARCFRMDWVMTVRLFSVLALLVVVPACSNGPEVDDPTQSLPVGSHGHLAVDAHCGFEFTVIDGETWRTDEAVFEASNVDLRAVFTPAPDATYTCM
jgi:hypothetical protein